MNRKDNWSNEDDQFLANTVLDYIRNGKTQLQAFTDVGVILKRTAAACGFRWNDTVRHRYSEAIARAKKEKHIKKANPKRSNQNNNSFDKLIEYLIQSQQDYMETELKIKNIRNKITELTIEIEERRIEQSIDTTQNRTALLQLISKAEQLGLFEDNKKPAI